MKFITPAVVLSLVFVINLTFAQERYEDRPLVLEAAYYDETPPLRDMEVILPGERKRAWKDDIIGNKSMEEQFKNQQADVPANFTDPVLQDFHTASRDITGPVMNFDGVNNVNGVYPPDTDGDVGPDHYFQMINLSFAIWDKSGNQLYGPVDNSTLWSGFIGPWTGTNDGDPIVLYDELADRWMASQFAINTSNGSYWQLVAVSTSPDPLGTYHRYAFQMPAFNDYPKLGIWPDGYYATFNMFGSYTRVGVAAFERDSMLVGAPARMVYFDQSSSTFSMLPADFDGTPPPDDSPCYFAHLRTFDSGDLEIYEFDVDWSDPSNSSFTEVSNLNTASFNPNIFGIPQPNTSTELDVLNFMLMFRLQYRNFGTHEVLLTNHTVNAGGRAGIRWYEVRKDTDDWYIYQEGTYSPDTENRWMGSIAMNGNGDIAIGYNISSSSTYPSIYYTGRRSTDPLGQMTIPEVLIYGGTYSQSGIDRWGDYACMSVDPVDDSTFWFTTEYMASGWRTRIASFDFGPILPPAVNAGPDAVICETEPFMAEATASYQQSIMWETSGDGFFVDPTKINAVYLRGQGDVTEGEVQLTVTAFGYDPGTDVVDSLMLSFSKTAVAEAGNDTTINQGDDVQLNGMVMYTDSLYWETDGDGTFSDTAIVDPVYTPGLDDIANGSVSLWLNAVDTIPCENDTRDRVRVFIDELTGIFQPDNDDNGLELSIVPNPVNDVFTYTINGLKSGFVFLEISDMQGQAVFTQKLESAGGTHSNRINMGYLPRGIYVMKVSTVEGTIVEKILLQ
jgi:hypothetical protein